VLLADLLKDLKEENGEYSQCINSLETGEVRFAYICGIYNGFIELLASIPDLAKLAFTPLSSEGRKEFNKLYTGLNEFKKINENGEFLCSGVGCAIKYSILRSIKAPQLQ
jgi:hypothetical protein